MDSNCTYTEMLIQNYSNFNKSGAPARFMYYENGNWSDFPADVADSLRVGFSERKAVLEAVIDGATWLFDFHRMLQVQLDGCDERSVAWIDVNGTCFFPKQFIDGNRKFNSGTGNFNCGNEDQVKSRKRRREGILEGRSLNYEVVSPRWPRARVLGETERAYSVVRDLFLGGIRSVDPGARVTGIHQVVRSRPLDRARFEVFRKQMEITKAARGGANMTFAWHGTSEMGVEVILRHGFSEVSVSRDYGVGVYLLPAKSAHISKNFFSAMLSEVDSNGEKHAILCRVLMGKCEKVEAGSQQLYPSSVDFDTGVDDLNNPKWYVVWGTNMNTHILPECVVSYRPTIPSPGQLRGSTVAKASPNSPALFAKLFSRLGTSLPSSRMQEFRNLFSAYKEGKMAKDCFVKQLRSVVGDEKLAAVIREVRD